MLDREQVVHPLDRTLCNQGVEIPVAEGDIDRRMRAKALIRFDVVAFIVCGVKRPTRL